MGSGGGRCRGLNRMVRERAASCETSRLLSRGCSSAGSSSPHAIAFLRRHCRHGLARHRPPRVLLSATSPFPRVLAFNAKHPGYICEAMGILFSCDDERNMTGQPIVPCEHNCWGISWSMRQNLKESD
ncbi:hypothetical protein VPH35_028287 [Triticum aestivum]